MWGPIVKGQKVKGLSWRKKVSAKLRWNLKSLLFTSFIVQNGRQHEETLLSGDSPSVADRSSVRRCWYATLLDAEWRLVLSNGNATDFSSAAHRIAPHLGDLIELTTCSLFSSGPSVRIRYFIQNKSWILFPSWPLHISVHSKFILEQVTTAHTGSRCITLLSL